MGGWLSFCKVTESDRTPPSEGVKCLCIGRPPRPGSCVTEVLNKPRLMNKPLAGWQHNPTTVLLGS